MPKITTHWVRNHHREIVSLVLVVGVIVAVVSFALYNMGSSISTILSQVGGTPPP